MIFLWQTGRPQSIVKCHKLSYFQRKQFRTRFFLRHRIDGLFLENWVTLRYLSVPLVGKIGCCDRVQSSSVSTIIERANGDAANFGMPMT